MSHENNHGDSDNSALLGPEIPYLHGSEKEQRLAAIALYSIIGLSLLVLMGFGGTLLVLFLITPILALATLVLQKTSSVRVSFTTMTNCVNVLLVSVFVNLLLWKIVGEALLDVDMSQMGSFIKDIKKASFAVGIFNFVMYCIGFFVSGRLVWRRSMQDIWKAGTIVIIFAAIMYIIVFPIVIVNAMDQAMKMVG